MSKKPITLLLTVCLILSAEATAFAGTPASTGSTKPVSDTQQAGMQSAQDASTDAAEGNNSSSDSLTSPSSDAEASSSETDIISGTSGEETPSEADVSKNETPKTSETDKKVEAEKAAKAKKAAEKKAAEKKAKNYEKGLAAYIRTKNPSLSKSWSLTLAGYFVDAGKKYDLDPTILMAIAQRESTFRANATNPYGIKGMMQTSDSLARQYGYKPSSLYKAKVSIDVGARYLRSLKKKFGTYTKALSGYVYGSLAVTRGTYSKAHANDTLRIRREINDYLKKHNYI